MGYLCLAAGFFGGAPVRADLLDQIGVTQLRAMTTNVNGAGIRVAQAEADVSMSPLGFEVNPGNVGQPVSLFSYYTSNGVAATYPNSLGADSGHADGVANFFYGMAYGVATNVAHVDNYEANYFLDLILSAFTPINAVVLNQSFTFGSLSAAVQMNQDSIYDDYSMLNQVLFVSAANNYGTTGYNSTNVCSPGTSYNCISVGAYQNGSYHNGHGPTIDNGRCKPDISGVANVTSDSTPQVSGAVAVLMQAALRGDGGSDTNSAFDMRTIKALLLNGAVKPLGWTNSKSSPLDARYGAGVVNVFNAYKQLAGGKHGCTVATNVSLNAAHPPTGAAGAVSVLSGWDFNTNSSGLTTDGVNHYYFNVTNAAGSAKFIATATLVWNRQYQQTDINNLNLFLYNCANSNLVTCSTSLVDNVEHFCLTNLAAGRYDLQVWKAGGSLDWPDYLVSYAEPYALAWEFCPPPTLTAVGGMNRTLKWPVYPAGYLVEARTNLTGGAWSTSNVPAIVITNGQNNIFLNPTNAGQFFRLRRPNL